MLDDAGLLIAGGVVAAAGGDLFVRGAVGLAGVLRVRPAVIGATVAAFATSTPELSVALNAAAEGESRIPLGDALGSNVANLGLILGVALLVSSMQVSRGTLRRDVLVALLSPALLAVLLLDGRLAVADGLLLIGAFTGWLTWTIVTAGRERPVASEIENQQRRWRVAFLTAAGLALLIAAGRLLVVGARGLGEELGADPFVVGATLVAFATSAPELATTVVAALRGHAAVGLGTLLGSNIFNGLWIVGIVAAIEPIAAPLSEVVVALVAGAAVVLLAVPPARGRLERGRGLALLAGYATYVAIMAARSSSV